jgi:hypothetical protein
MRTPRPVRTPAVLLAVVGVAASALLATSAAAQSPEPVQVRTDATPETAVFPNDRFTVADSRQLTGLRVALPVPDCTEATRSICDAARILNTADGFDVQPRFFIPFTGDIDVATVTPESVYVEGPAGGSGCRS